MSKEREIQDELERYWDQLDRLEKSLIFMRNQINRFDKVERMLKFLCIRARVMDIEGLDDASVMPLHGKALARLKKLLKAYPDISDILEGK